MTRSGIRAQDGVAAEDGGVLRLHDLLVPERVKIPLTGSTKEELLRDLVRLVAGSTDLEREEEAIFQAVWEREQVLSTGIGDGIALPHAKYNDLDRVILAAGVSARPVEFDALDGRPVQLFFLMLGPESAAGEQVRVLSRISRLMRDRSLRRRLIESGDPVRFLKILREAERGV